MTEKKYIEVDEKDDDEFIELKNDERHKELLLVLGKLITAVNDSAKKDTSNDIAAAIEKNSQAVKGFVAKIGELSKPQQQPIKVEQDKTIAAISGMSGDIIASLNKVSEGLAELKKPQEWVFTVDRYYGTIQKVIAKAK